VNPPWRCRYGFDADVLRMFVSGWF